MTRVVIIDDEQPAREIVKLFLYGSPDFEVVAQCKNGFEGVKAISEHKPDLIFLDIQMPKIDGFEMLELIEDPPAVIFCTAYDEYAIKAFEHKAVDYLLKPFTKERFKEALIKLKYPVTQQDSTELTELYHQDIERIAVKTGDKIDIIPLNQVDYLESQDDYVEIHSKGKKYLKQQTMKYYESVLNPDQFVRTHRRFIVNIKEISGLEKYGKESYVAILKNNDSISVSASGYSKLKGVLHL